MTRHTAKSKLKALKLTQQVAAQMLGVSYEHLNRVLNGHRESRRLLAALATLPRNPAA